MIHDGELSFINPGKTLSTSFTVSDNVVNLGVGESYEPMKLATAIAGGTGTSPTMTVTIQTATDENFTSPVDLGSFTISGTGNKGKTVPIPRGNLGYMRLNFSSTYTGGKISSGLVVDDDIPHRK